MDTTYVDRNNTNQKVFQEANRKLEEEGKPKEVKTFVETYKAQKIKRALRIIRKEGTPIHNISFSEGKLKKWTHPRRREGRPRMNWTEETIREVWNHLKKDDNRYKYTAFDGENEEHISYIKSKANNE